MPDVTSEAGTGVGNVAVEGALAVECAVGTVEEWNMTLTRSVTFKNDAGDVMVTVALGKKKKEKKL